MEQLEGSLLIQSAAWGENNWSVKGLMRRVLRSPAIL